MVVGMAWTEPVTTVLPGHHVEFIRTIVAEGQARSMSAWIAEAVAKLLADSREGGIPGVAIAATRSHDQWPCGNG